LPDPLNTSCSVYHHEGSSTGTNQIRDFTAVTFSVKLGVIREKLTLP